MAAGAFECERNDARLNACLEANPLENALLLKRTFASPRYDGVQAPVFLEDNSVLHGIRHGLHVFYESSRA
jgi:hypothetical protein